jgi:transcriptional regulator with XRE-family HTH domain
MPERPHKVTPESARLGRELRALRTLVKLSQQDVAGTLEVSKSTVQRVESGEQRPSRGQVRKWAEVTKASDEVTRRVIVMAEAMHGATWSDALAAEPVQHLQGVAARRDEEARLIRVWTPLIVPGLLNTAAYAREVIREMDPTGEMDIAAAASARIERQQILYRGGRRFEFLVGEEALRWSPGPAGSTRSAGQPGRRQPRRGARPTSRRGGLASIRLPRAGGRRPCLRHAGADLV